MADYFPSFQWRNDLPSPGLDAFSSNSNPPFGSKGSNMFDPTTLALGGISAGLGALGSIWSSNTQAQMANAQMAAAGDALKQNIYLNRDLSKFGEGGNIGARVAQSTYMPELELGRQRRAAFEEAGPLGEARGAFGRGQNLANIGIGQSAFIKKADQEANREAVKKAAAERQAQMASTFGPIAPLRSENLFVV